MSGSPLFEVEGLAKTWRSRGGLFAPRRVVRAVDGVAFSVARGETVAIVGESGSGKTTAARAALRLVEPDEGRILYRRESGAPPIDVRALSASALRRVRRDLQIVFQDPWSSLNPRHPVREIVGEALFVHGIARGVELERRVGALLERVGLAPETARRFPHELSGGMRQRVGIARAIALEPRFLVCDEPVAALDVSLQAQVLNLLADLQEELGLACLFIAHDLAIVRHVADRVLVMYAGRIVEEGTVEEVFEQAAHPYTQALLAAIPRIVRLQVGGEPGLAVAGRTAGEHVPARVPVGGAPGLVRSGRSDESAGSHVVAGAREAACPYRARCAFAEIRCAEREPARVRLSATHVVACHLVEGPEITART